MIWKESSYKCLCFLLWRFGVFYFVSVDFSFGNHRIRHEICMINCMMSWHCMINRVNDDNECKSHSLNWQRDKKAVQRTLFAENKKHQPSFVSDSIKRRIRFDMCTCIVAEKAIIMLSLRLETIANNTRKECDSKVLYANKIIQK